MFSRGSICILLLGLFSQIIAQNWNFYEGPWCAKDLIDVAVGAHNGNVVVYAVNKDYSLAKSTNEGQSWTILLTDVDIRCVTCDPNEANRVYIGCLSADEGIRYSPDGGVIWLPKNTGLPPTFTPTNIAMRDQNHIVLGLEPQSATEYSVYYWDINHWEPAVFPTPEYKGFRVTDLKWDSRPGYEPYIYASSDTVAQGGNQNFIGVYHSINDGHNWTQIGHPDPGQPQGYMSCAEALSVDCGGNGYIYAGYRPHGGSHDDGGVMRTTDGGANWEIVLQRNWLPVNDVLGDLTNPDKVYAAFGSSDDYSYDGAGIFLYDGASWNAFNEGLTDLYTNVLATLQVGLQYHLYLGTDNSCYIRNLSSPTEDWFERVKGMHKPTVIAVEPRIPNFFAFSDRANYASLDNGANWSTRSAVARSSENFSAEVHPSSNNEMLKWTKVWVPNPPPDHAAHQIDHSSDGGLLWRATYIEHDPELPSIPDFAYGYYPNDPTHKVYTFNNTYRTIYRQLLSSSDFGNSWNEYNTPYHYVYITSLACDPNYDCENHIYITGFETYESQDGGSHWTIRSMVHDYMGAMITFKPTDGSGLDSELLQEWESSSGSYPTFSKTSDFGQNWIDISAIEEYQLGPFIIDPEEPSLVYTAPLDPNTNYSDVYLSVDYCRVWLLDSRGLPDVRVWDLEVDPNSPQYLYAGTDSGIYYYDPPFNKHMVSSSSQATSINNGKKMLRGGINNFWVTYESGNVIYAVHSSDGGQTWSQKMEIGEGINPVISSNPDLETPNPGIMWRVQNNRDTLYFSRHITDHQWTTPVAIVTTDSDYGPPSFIIGNDNIGRVVYEMDNRIFYTQFNIFTPVPTTDPHIGSGSNPSIGFMIPGSLNPEIHVIWEDNGKIRYRSRPILGTWSEEETIFTNNSTHPSIEIAGTNVYVVWERLGDIYYRYAVYRNGDHYWSRYEIPCPTADGSFYPVLTGGSVISWTEFVEQAYYDIYFCYYDAGIGWIGPINMSASTQPSKYSHITHKQVLDRTTVYFVWTEGNADILGLYDIVFDTYSFGGINLDADLPFYVAQGGDTTASPFNLQREGYIQYGTHPYKRIDYDAEYLEYQFELLNPEREYALAAYAYQEGYNNLPITVRVDNILIGGITLPPDTLIICKHMLPLELYTDSAVNIKIFGNDAVSAALVIYEYENDSTGGGGPQSLGDLPLNFDSPIMNVFPNPVQKEINIQYTLFRETKVNLSIFDVAGRSVRNVISKNQISGTYHKSLSIVNLPQGVYFIKLDTSDDAIVQKVIFIK